MTDTSAKSETTKKYILKSERLGFRWWTADDLPLAQQLWGDLEVTKYFGGPFSEDEVRNKAKRFAKLLVEEIKLYNQSKVSEGRSTKDLYDRLKDDIDKSRATYDKRYGQTVKDVDYFTQELVRILADNDRTVLGANFRW